MSACRSTFAAVWCGVAMSIAASIPGAAAPPDEGLGGCNRGNVLTGDVLPGSGSAGQSVRREADLWECSSPLLPGIVSGRFHAEVPWLAFGAPSAATFTWSDGSVSRATGLPNTLWTVVDGPASGHVIRFQLAENMNGHWYYIGGSKAIVSMEFMR